MPRYVSDYAFRARLVAGRVGVISALWPGVISACSSSTDANHRRASGDGITTMDMMMDMAPGATDPNTGASYPASSDPGTTGASWATKPATSTAGPSKRVRGKRYDEHDADNRG